MRKIFNILISLVILGSVARAESRVGNGGYGVRIGGAVYALDLAARGVHHAPYLSEGVVDQLPAPVRAKLEQGLARVTAPEVVALVATKLAELQRRIGEQQIRYYDVARIVEAMDQYHWVNTVDLPCVDVGDDQSPFPNKVQLAFRQNGWVRFCADFNGLDRPDQAAIVLHELVYGLHVEAQPFVSQLTGFLFSPDFAAFGARDGEELKQTLAGLVGGDIITGPAPAAVVKVGGYIRFATGLAKIPSDILVTDETRLQVRVDPNDWHVLLLTGRKAGRVTVTMIDAEGRHPYVIDVVP